jgi:type VI secretion system protein VasD
VTVASSGIGAALGLALCGVLVACAQKEPPPPPPPTKVELTLTAADGVNPDPEGRASPVIVRYYQLAGTNAFEKADFFQLYDKEAALLGQDLLGRDEVPLAPGATQKAAFEAKAGTKFLGVVAAYRDINQAEWRADVPIPANQTTKLKVTLDKLKLSIAPDGG